MSGFLFWWLGVAGVVLHVAFMLGEMLPPSDPMVLRKLSSKRLPTGAAFDRDQKAFVVNIVKNAGIYNGIVAAALLSVAFTGDRDVARVLLTGITVAGVFGGITLSSLVWAQAVFGLIGIAAIYVG